MRQWFNKNMPRREQLAEHRLLGRYAGRVLRPDLWRFTRRSVPRGVGLGLFVGILIMIPGVQIAGAALLCIPFRANVPIAVLMTFISIPVTTPAFVAAGYFVGNRILQYEHLAPKSPMSATTQTWLAEQLQWLVAASVPAILGLFVIASAFAGVGYIVSGVGWRLWIARKWRRRHKATEHPAIPD